MLADDQAVVLHSIIMDHEKMDNISSDNQNCSVDGYVDNHYYLFYISMIGVIGCVSIVGNILVITVMLRTAKLRIPSNYFIINLAFSDLMQGLVYPIYNIGHMPDFKLTEALCKCTIKFSVGHVYER